MKKIISYCFLFLLTCGLFAQSKTEVKKVQEALITLDYKPGSADGVWGTKTQVALKKFQADAKIPESGQLDSATISVIQIQLKAFISESKTLVKNMQIAGVKITGNISVSTMQDCRELVFWPSLRNEEKGEIPNRFELFYPGLTLSTSSLVCLPEKGLSIILDGSEDQSVLKFGTFGSKDKNSPYADQIIDPTVGYIKNVPEDAKVFVLQPTSGEMVFKINREGFRHISGIGTVTVPGGKVYSFPIED